VAPRESTKGCYKGQSLLKRRTAFVTISIYFAWITEASSLARSWSCDGSPQKTCKRYLPAKQDVGTSSVVKREQEQHELLVTCLRGHRKTLHLVLKQRRHFLWPSQPQNRDHHLARMPQRKRLKNTCWFRVHLAEGPQQKSDNQTMFDVPDPLIVHVVLLIHEFYVWYCLPPSFLVSSVWQSIFSCVRNTQMMIPPLCQIKSPSLQSMRLLSTSTY